MDDERGFFFQPCFSVVWDTGIAAYALGESGLVPEQALARAADWLLTKEVRRKGDWSVKRPNVEPSGWYFEFANEFYPDIDDTAQVLLALAQRARHRCRRSRTPACSARSTGCWPCKSKDGGWAAFDVDNNWEFLSSVPFADHNAMLDPTCPDITGRVLEALVRVRRRARSSGGAARRRVSEAHAGSRTEAGTDAGASITSTAPSWRCAVCEAAGESDREAYILRAGEWLRSIQNADGGWGESCASYDQNTFVAGAQHAVANRLGDSRACWPAATPPAAACRRASNI